jgi:hypothetical protein
MAMPINSCNEEAIMREAKLSRSNWTTEDHAVYAKWRKSVVILYGALGLTLLVGTATHHLTNYRPQVAAALPASLAGGMP